jgi:hypothetical protein
VTAVASASEPSYDLPTMADRPLSQSATTVRPAASRAVARPFSQLIACLALRLSSLALVVGQPVELPVPTMSSRITAYPRGTK